MKSSMLIIFLVFSFGFTRWEDVITAQTPDYIKFNGKEYALNTNPLEPYFEKYPEKRPQWYSTALYRGYIGHFEIIDSTLLLTDISQPRRIKDKDGTIRYKNISIKKRIFPGIDSLKIDWYSGILILPHGERIKYVHQGYASEYSHYVLLEIKKGRFRKHKAYKHKQFLKFKERQYEAFKKTEAYKIEYRKLQENYPPDFKKSIEKFLKDYVTNYTSEFLVD
ncbi:MAG: hypothetical protein HRT65_14240 [Flavobacteriaceae bacterium]|nr:hypothetical protein [Flavobacteriaceae bacterium]